jgi:cytoskeletal protein CcmA (bactofilin family)
VLGDVTGNVTGNLTGHVTGDVTGAASLNVLKTGDTLTGDINWSTTGRGLTWGMNSDGASIKFYNVSDFESDSRLEFQTTDNGNEYFRWTYATNNGSDVVESMRLTPNSLNNAALRIFGSITVDGDVLGNVTGNVLGDVTGNLTGDVLGDVTGNVLGDLTGNVLGDVTGNVTGNVLGDVTGNLTGNVLGDLTGNADTVTNGVYTTSSITALADVDTSTVIPTIGQGLIWSGANWIPGTVSTTENNTFEFGGFIKTFIDPVSYLLNAVGVDFGTFTVPASYTIDLGTF